MCEHHQNNNQHLTILIIIQRGNSVLYNIYKRTNLPILFRSLDFLFIHYLIVLQK